MVLPRVTRETLTSIKKLFLNFKLHQTEESGRKESIAIESSERPDNTHQQRQPQHLQVLEILQELSNLIVLENNGGENDPEDEPIPAESAWVISIEEKIQRARQANEARPWAGHSIYRIPQNLKYGKNEAYIPRMVSLGPYHRHKKHLRRMDWHKWRCLDFILMRTGKKIDHFLAPVEKVEDRARACYEGTIPMNSKEFVEMMVVDGCFVIELLLGFTKTFPTLGYLSDDPVFSTQGSMHAIRRDMIMLENQIPLFILGMLLGLQLNKPDQTDLVAKLAIVFFEPLKPTDAPPINFEELEELITSQQDKLHCLDVFRESLLYWMPKGGEDQGVLSEAACCTGCQWGGKTKGSSQRRHELIHCVTDLRKAGIKFRKRREHMIWDIRFKCGILRIPQLVIHDGTRSLFLNLIAFEQRHVRCGNAITSYVVFMDNLINSPEDVGHLHDRGIIEHWLGSDAEVADLFNQLCKEVDFDIHDSYLSKLSTDVNSYASHRWNGWIASLKLKYFSNPWSIISLFAAFILLMLTSAQTFYGVYGYYKPRS